MRWASSSLNPMCAAMRSGCRLARPVQRLLIPGLAGPQHDPRGVERRQLVAERLEQIEALLFDHPRNHPDERTAHAPRRLARRPERASSSRFAAALPVTSSAS